MALAGGGMALAGGGMAVVRTLSRTHAHDVSLSLAHTRTQTYALSRAYTHAHAPRDTPARSRCAGSRWSHSLAPGTGGCSSGRRWSKKLVRQRSRGAHAHSTDCAPTKYGTVLRQNMVLQQNVGCAPTKCGLCSNKIRTVLRQNVGCAPTKCGLCSNKIWTVLQHDGPNHLAACEVCENCIPTAMHRVCITRCIAYASLMHLMHRALREPCAFDQCTLLQQNMDCAPTKHGLRANTMARITWPHVKLRVSDQPLESMPCWWPVEGTREEAVKTRGKAVKTHKEGQKYRQ